MTLRISGPVVGLTTAAIAVSTLVGFQAADGYEVTVPLASAANLVKGGPVLVNGFEAGSVEEINVRDGKAMVRVRLEDDVAPLHEGAQVTMSWKAVLSERQLVVTDGPSSNAEIPDDGIVPGAQAQPMEVDDVLNALDAPTRAKLVGLVSELEKTLDGQEGDARETVASAGPALRELGQVLQAVGTDGPALRTLVAEMNQMVRAVAERDESMSTIVSRLDDLTDHIATRRDDLDETLVRLPGTLKQATKTLKSVPPAADAAVPLLADLDPATAKLGRAAKSLKPVLQDLRPAAADLRPAVSSLNELLGHTPGLLDSLNDVLPDVDSLVEDVREPVDFMRPYTPEITGVITNWNSAFSNWDSNGNYTRLHIQAGLSSFNNNPGIPLPGIVNDPYPAPGAVVGQPWTDANGSSLR